MSNQIQATKPHIATEQTFNQTSYDSGFRDAAAQQSYEMGRKIKGIYETLSGVKYLDWTFYVGSKGPSMYLQVSFDINGKHWTGRKWLLSEHMTKSEIIQTAFKAVLTAVEHETREMFTYKGKAIFGPHFDVDVLAQVADCVDVRK